MKPTMWVQEIKFRFLGSAASILTHRVSLLTEPSYRLCFLIFILTFFFSILFEGVYFIFLFLGIRESNPAPHPVLELSL